MASKIPASMAGFVAKCTINTCKNYAQQGWNFIKNNKNNEI